MQSLSAYIYLPAKCGDFLLAWNPCGSVGVIRFAHLVTV